MILRTMTISECWCGKCHGGLMGQIHDIMMQEKLSMKDMIGRHVICKHCDNEDIIDDVLELIPTTYLVASKSEISKTKSNEELKNWLEE